MSENDDIDIALIAHQVKRYLSAHPNAADSVEGVAQWWLVRQRYEQTLDKVTKALEYLVANGDVEKRTNSSGIEVYSMHKFRAH